MDKCETLKQARLKTTFYRSQNRDGMTCFSAFPQVCLSDGMLVTKSKCHEDKIQVWFIQKIWRFTALSVLVRWQTTFYSAKNFEAI